MKINIVFSDTYLDSFSKLDKKMQKKSFETVRQMQRSLRSDSLKIEKLKTKLDFKSARVTRDFRAIFTQSGNTLLLVYIGHHEEAYQWASRRLQGFDVENAKPAYEYFEQSKKVGFDLQNEEIVEKLPDKQQIKKSENMGLDTQKALSVPLSGNSAEIVGKSENKTKTVISKILDLILKLFIFLIGIGTGVMLMYYLK